MGDAKNGSSKPADAPKLPKAKQKQKQSNKQRRIPFLRRRRSSGDMTSNLHVVNMSPEEAGLEEDYKLYAPQLWQRDPHDEVVDSSATTPELKNSAYAYSSPSGYGGDVMSPLQAPTPPSVDDIAEEEPQSEQRARPKSALYPSREQQEDDPDSYDLKPPRPAVPQSKVDTNSIRFFSNDHLDVILRDYALAQRFTRFLEQYRPQYTNSLKQYVAAKKAIAAVEYANAVAEKVHFPLGHSSYVAANIDERFKDNMKQIVEELVEEALPSYLTHRLVSLVTDTLVKEITGNSAPIMHDLIPSLAEVYCITDPSQSDNPIVYASEEFYNLTEYSKDYVIGRNCRFLQGPDSSRMTVKRLVDAQKKGEECCETILNYKRDGSPFLNLLMLAPMYDNKGTVRYYLGAQIDVSSLIEQGRGMESFAQLLSQDRFHERNGSPKQRDPNKLLSDLGQMLTEDESDIVKSRTRGLSLKSQDSASVSRATSSAARPQAQSRPSRIVLGMDEQVRDPPLWSSPKLGTSGRLPGVYQNYLLVRPYPSLRITFTSPAMRIPGLLQQKLLDRIGGPSSVREGLQDALSRGTGVTAKVTWLTNNDSNEGKSRWLHCTPLFGSDDRVGVWMVVMVENEQVTGSLKRDGGNAKTNGERGGGNDVTSNRLYADYLKGNGRPGTQGTDATNSSTREARYAEEQFRDF